MFEDLKIKVKVVPSRIDETMENNISGVDYATVMAKKKAESVSELLAKKGEKPWVVAADTVVVIDGKILTKPVDRKESIKMLKMLSGKEHVVVTGWTVGKKDGPWHLEYEETTVKFHNLTDEEISWYAGTGEGDDKAGAYAIQGLGSYLVESIEGNYFNVVGLPVSRVVRRLKKFGAIKKLV